MNGISAVKPHACHQCGISFGRRYNLRRHVENVHAEDESKMSEVDDEAIQCENSDVDHEPNFKKRRFQDSDIQSYENESAQDNEDFEEDNLDSETEEEDNDSSDEDGSSSELEDNAAYRDWLDEAKEATYEMWSEKYEKYINLSMGEDQAKEKANRKTLWAVKRIFFNSYKDFLSSYLHLKDNDSHQDIVEDLEEKVNP